MKSVQNLYRFGAKWPEANIHLKKFDHAKYEGPESKKHARKSLKDQAMPENEEARRAKHVDLLMKKYAVFLNHFPEDRRLLGLGGPDSEEKILRVWKQIATSTPDHSLQVKAHAQRWKEMEKHQRKAVPKGKLDFVPLDFRSTKVLQHGIKTLEAKNDPKGPPQHFNLHKLIDSLEGAPYFRLVEPRQIRPPRYGPDFDADAVDRSRLSSSTAFGVTYKSQLWRQSMEEWIRKPHLLKKDIDMLREERYAEYVGSDRESGLFQDKRIYSALLQTPRAYHGALPLQYISQHYGELREKGWELEPCIPSDFYCRDRIAHVNAESNFGGLKRGTLRGHHQRLVLNTSKQLNYIRHHIALLREETLLINQKSRFNPTMSTMQSHVLREKRQMMSWAMEDWQKELRRCEERQEKLARVDDSFRWKGHVYTTDPTLPFFDTRRGKAALAVAAVGGTVSGLTGAGAGWWGSAAAKRQTSAPGNGTGNSTQTVTNSTGNSTQPASNSTTKES